MTRHLIGGLILAVALVTGCATGTSRAVHATTDTLGIAANAAIDGMAGALTLQAIQAIGPEATEETVNAWIQERDDWQKAKKLYDDFSAVYRLWLAGNAAAASGDDTVAQVDISRVMIAAQELFVFIGRYSSEVKTWAVVPAQ